MDVVGACELHASTKRVGVPTMLDECRRNGEADECQPCQRQRVDPAEHPEARDTLGEERHVSDRKGDRGVVTAFDRPHQRDRTRI